MPRFVDDYLSYLLARAGQRVADEFHREVRRAGLGVPVWRLLATLYDGAPRGVGELAAAIIAQQPTVTKQLDRLAALGLVARRRGVGDRRRVSVAITPAGRLRVAPLVRAARRHERALLAQFAARDIARLKRMLAALIADD